MALARETPRLHVNAVEPGLTLATGLGRDSGAFGHPMLGSALVRDPKFQDRVLAETRALLANAAG